MDNKERMKEIRREIKNLTVERRMLLRRQRAFRIELDELKEKQK